MTVTLRGNQKSQKSQALMPNSSSHVSRNKKNSKPIPNPPHTKKINRKIHHFPHHHSSTDISQQQEITEADQVSLNP